MIHWNDRFAYEGDKLGEDKLGDGENNNNKKQTNKHTHKKN